MHTPWAGREQLGQAQPYAAPHLQTPVLLTARDEKDSLSEVIKAPYNPATCEQAAPRPHTAPRNTRSHLLQRGRAPAWLWQMSPRRELWMEHHMPRKEPLVVTLLCPELTLRVPLLPQTSRPSRARPGHCQPLGSAQSRAGADPKELAGIRDKCRALNPTARALSAAHRRTTPRQAEHPAVLTGLPGPHTVHAAFHHDPRGSEPFGRHPAMLTQQRLLKWKSKAESIPPVLLFFRKRKHPSVCSSVTKREELQR